MEKQNDRIKIYILIAFLVQAAIVVVLNVVFHTSFQLLAVIFMLVDLALCAYIVFHYERERNERMLSVSRVLGNDAKNAMVYGQMGIIVYNDDYEAIWVSELFDSRNLHLLNEKLTKTIPGIEILFSGGTDSAVFHIGDRDYEFTRNADSQVLFVKDITELKDLQEKYANEKVVLGLVHLDNYAETIQYEDEQKIAMINTRVRQQVVEWCSRNNAVVRRLRSDRFFVVVNEQNFRKILDDKFSILETIKNEANGINVAITASMAFAYGTSDFLELDTMCNDLLELVLSRGGDQVAVRCYGENVHFYGTSSEANEKTSKVKARVVAQTIRDIIMESDMVFIVPHKEADFDSIGACMGVSAIVQAYGKAAYIVLKDILVEQSAREAIERNLDKLLSNHSMVSQDEAVDMMSRQTTVIVCDHHSMDLTSAPELIKKAAKVVVIDHHRRKTDTNISAMMVYNEPSSSSTVELISELIQYQPVKTDISDFDATYMYAGLLVDTDNFRSRCSSRSFEACAYLKKSGADISLANDWLKDTMEQFETKTRVLKYSEVINGNIIVAALPEKEGTISRTMVAQVANYALSIKDIIASFVIAPIDDGVIACSGRSTGEVNVQIVLEKMGGGGHFAAAGLQRRETTTKALHDELMENLKEYIREEKSHESNTAG